MKKVIRVLKKFFQNKTYVKRLTIALLVILFSFIIFLVVNLFNMYFGSVKNNGVKLYYEFGPNTVKYAYDDATSTSDISEQFLSYGISYGIDVSEWQGKIDWNKVRATGISFAMIRCGFRETHGSNVKEDAMFKENIKGAIDAGLKVGVYFFGTAKNEKEALEEAEFTMNLIKDYNLTYPVAYDTESFDKGRLQGVSYSTLTDNILTFTETINSYGYDTMVYSYFNAFNGMLDTGKLDGKLIWLAHYVDDTTYKGNYSMWQYTSEGRVDGIKTNVDLNISYFTYVDDETKIKENPNKQEASVVDFATVDENVVTIKNAVIRSTPTKDVPNKLGTLKRGMTLKRIGISSELSKVIYNGKEIYIDNDYVRVSS